MEEVKNVRELRNYRDNVSFNLQCKLMRGPDFYLYDITSQGIRFIW